MTPHLNHLIEMVLMRGHNIRFYEELSKFIIKNSKAVLAGENGACLFFVSSCYRGFCGCLGVLRWYQVSTGLLHSFC